MVSKNTRVSIGSCEGKCNENTRTVKHSREIDVSLAGTLAEKREGNSIVFCESRLAKSLSDCCEQNQVRISCRICGGKKVQSMRVLAASCKEAGRWLWASFCGSEMQMMRSSCHVWEIEVIASAAILWYFRSWPHRRLSLQWTPQLITNLSKVWSWWFLDTCRQVFVFSAIYHCCDSEESVQACFLPLALYFHFHILWFFLCWFVFVFWIISLSYWMYLLKLYRGFYVVFL